MSNREKVIRALCEVFNLKREQVERDVFTGKTDPGQWSPRAEVVIHTEGAIPSDGGYSVSITEKWFAVTEKLDGLFCEPVNGAVVAVHKS